MPAALVAARPFRLLTRLAAAAALFGLAACAQTSRPEAMAAAPPAAEPLPGESYRVDKVTGGEDTNPILMSQVSDGGFRKALERSLERAAIWDPESGLRIDATLLGLKQPLIGFDMTVTASARYQVYDEAGRALWDEVFTTPYTADFSDAFIGSKRLQLANEGAIKANISRFLEALIAQKLPLKAQAEAGSPTS